MRNRAVGVVVKLGALVPLLETVAERFANNRLDPANKGALWIAQD
jgi:hypothetical protein